MKNWIIKLLGGYTFKQYEGVIHESHRMHKKLEGLLLVEKKYKDQTKFEIKYDDFRGHKIILDKLSRDVYVPESLLEQARKNDTPRDPKTGRFVKK